MAKLGYKFVNPGLTSKDKETLKVAGVKSGSKTKLPSGKIILGLNRIGLTIEGIGQTIKGLKSIEEVRAISLRGREVEERREDRDRQLDQKESSQERGRVGGKLDEKKLKDETKRKHGGKIKKAGGLLQQLLMPLWNLISPFISFAAVMGILKWFQDEKNQEKVKKLVEFAGVVFKFLWDWATFGVSTLLDGFANLFGGISKIQKGELGGVWDTIMGFGQLLVGFVALKGLAMFLNPFSLMGGILDMLNLLSMDSGPDLPDAKNADELAEGALKKKSWLMKFKQRIRIMYKRVTIRWKKKVLKWADEIARVIGDLSAKVAAWGAAFFADVVKPLIDRAVKAATEAFDNIIKALPDDLVKGVKAGIDTVADAGSRLLKNADEVTKPLRDAAKPFVDDVAKVISDPGGALKSGLDTAAQGADDLFRWVANTGFGKTIQSGASQLKGAWDVTSDLAVKTFQSFKSGLDDFIKGVTEIPAMVTNQWTKIADDVAELAAKGKDFVVEKFLSPLKQGADDLIKNSPIGEFFVKNFADDAAEGAGAGLFKKFVDFAEPAVKGVKEAMDAAPFKIGPLDVIVDVLLAAMELKAGQNPTRVALKLTGSILGLIAGTAILGAIGAGTGGIGAAILAGVVTGATQWGGEWLAEKLADMIGIPDEEVSFLDAFDFSGEEDNTETPQASAGGLIRGVKMSMGGAIYGDQNEKAVLNALADAEGTSKYPNAGYNTQYTGKQFSGANHPREILGPSSLRSDAAGRYQFLSTTWDSVMGDPISPDRQDQGALKLIKGRGVDLSNGLDLKEIYRLGGEWASVEGGPNMQKGGGYGGQAKYTAEKFLGMYKGYGGTGDGVAPQAAPAADKYDPEKKYQVGDIVTKDGKTRVFDGMGWGAYTAGAVSSQGNVTQTLQGTSADSFEQAGTEKGSDDSGLASLAVLQAKGDDGFGGAAHKLLQAFAALFPGITLGALKPAKEKADGDKATPGSGSEPVNETGKPNAASVGSGFDEKFAAVLGNYEGLRLEAYADANYGWEIPTIGIGATYYPAGFRLDGKVKKGDTITEKEAYEIKSKHIVEHRQRLISELGSSDLYSKVPNNVKVALESKVFNYGSMGDTLKGIVKSSISSGDYGPVAGHFRNSLAKHNGGINSWRRNDEAGIIETGKSNRTGVSFAKASAGGRIHMAAGGMIQSSKTVAIQHEAEESEVMAVPVPKLIPMPINRTQGVNVTPVVSNASENSARFGNY
jgi:muramidase (phage lysozyme)/GH24 family phage-related lysozyme (muramidase)